MKKCPSCQQLFDDSNDFCLNDGTPLVGGSAAFHTPTQVIQTRGSGSFQQTSKPTSPILYLIIGLLAAGFVAALIFIFAVPGRNDEAKKSEPTGSVAPGITTPNALPPAADSKTAATNGAPPPRVTSQLSPGGDWSGEIIYPSGSVFSARLTVADSGDGQVSGQILWTLLRTTNQNKMHLAGTSATEFVRGTFDPDTRRLVVSGHSKNDPTGDLIILDKYRLTMSTDGRSLTGFSFGGKTRGRLTLRK